MMKLARILVIFSLLMFTCGLLDRYVSPAKARTTQKPLLEGTARGVK